MNKSESVVRAFLQGMLIWVVLETVMLAFTWNDFSAKVNDLLGTARDPLAAYIGGVIALYVSYIFYGTIVGLILGAVEYLDTRDSSEDRNDA